MPVKISKSMIAKLPADERDNVEQALWDKSGGFCWLCEQPMNRAADEIEADHDTPESDGGATDLDNLNLAHLSCNKAKRNAKTVPIRPYLKLAAHSKAAHGRLKYDGFLGHFGIEPKPSVITRSGGAATFEFPDSTSISVPVFSEP